MKKTDQDFYNYALNGSPGTDFTHWIEKMHFEYISGLHCQSCKGRNIKITIDPKTILWCEDCEKYSANITLGMISEVDYNTVTFLHEEKIKAILKAKG